MTGSYIAALIGTALIATAPAIAAPREAPPVAPVDAAASAKAERTRYCIEYTLTGSRIPKRECHVRSAWLDRGFDPLLAVR